MPGSWGQREGDGASGSALACRSVSGWCWEQLPPGSTAPTSLFYPGTLSHEGSFWKASKGWLKEPPPESPGQGEPVLGHPHAAGIRQ